MLTWKDGTHVTRQQQCEPHSAKLDQLYVPTLFNLFSIIESYILIGASKGLSV